MTTQELEEAIQIKKKHSNCAEALTRIASASDNVSYQAGVVASVYEYNMTDDQRKIVKALIEHLLSTNVEYLQAKIEAL